MTIMLDFVQPAGEAEPVQICKRRSWPATMSGAAGRRKVFGIEGSIGGLFRKVVNLAPTCRPPGQRLDRLCRGRQLGNWTATVCRIFRHDLCSAKTRPQMKSRDMISLDDNRSAAELWALAVWYREYAE